MSASIRPTRWPCWCSARARFVATVDLPTPPLPLATATRCLTPGRATFCGICGCMKSSGAFAELAEVFERVDAGVVAVVPDDLIRVRPAGRHGDRHRRAGLQLGVGEDAERVGRRFALLAARRA